MNIRERFLVLGVMLAALFPTLALAGGGGLGNWAIDGAWTTEDASASDGKGDLIVISRTGLGQFTIHWKTAKPHAWPGEAERTAYTGNMRATGLGEWEYTALGYIRAADGSTIAIAVLHGTFRIVGSDAAEHTSWAAIYPAGVDPFRGAPVWCGGPGSQALQRIPIVPVPCEE